MPPLTMVPFMKSGREFSPERRAKGEEVRASGTGERAGADLDAGVFIMEEDAFALESFGVKDPMLGAGGESGCQGE